VLIGHDEVASFYRTTCETGKNVIGALPMYMRVDDFGVVTEARWAEVLTGILARNEHGVTEADPNAHYLLTHNIFQIFSYTRAAKLVGDAPPTTRPATTTRNSIPRTSLLPEDAGRELAPLLDRATAMHKADTWHASPIIAG
jgi:hypothetical protein